MDSRFRGNDEGGAGLETEQPYRKILPMGFRSSISASFQARFHFFIAFSRWMAASIVSNISKCTRRLIPNRRVKPAILPSRC